MADLLTKPSEPENIAATLAREARKPFAIDAKGIAIPEGWTILDTEKLLPVPDRKKSIVSVSDENSFVSYAKRHGSLASCTIWCDANYQQGKVDYTAIINDHGQGADEQQWRDHLAKFAPELSVEWKRWNSNNKKSMSQFEFARQLALALMDTADEMEASAAQYRREQAEIQVAA